MQKKTQDNAEQLIRSLANIIKETGITEIEYDHDNCRIKVAKNTLINSNHLAQQNFIATQSNLSQQESLQKQNETLQLVEETNNQAKYNEENVLKAPMVGNAYLKPSPDSENFVKPQGDVKKGDTLLIIEAMKVMNSIRAHKDGKIDQILVSDGDPVEFDQPLVIIE